MPGNQHPLVSKMLLERLRSQCPKELPNGPSRELLEKITESSPMRPFDGFDSTREMVFALIGACCHAQKMLYESQASFETERARALAGFLDMLLVLADSVAGGVS